MLPQLRHLYCLRTDCAKWGNLGIAIHNLPFLDAFAKLRKVTISLVTSYCPSVRMAPTEQISRN
jgi:hypothetical protein